MCIFTETITKTAEERLFSNETPIWPASWPQARMEIAYHKRPLETAHNQCSPGHKSAPFPCLPPCAPSWNGSLSNLLKHGKQFPVPGSIQELFPPFSPCAVLGHLLRSTGDIRFVFQLPKACLLCKFPLINPVNCQTGGAGLFLQSLLALR